MTDKTSKSQESEFDDLLMEAQRAIEISCRDEQYIETLVPTSLILGSDYFVPKRQCDICHYSFPRERHREYCDYGGKIWCEECWLKKLREQKMENRNCGG